MNDRAHRYGRPQMHEDPIKDAMEAEQATVSLQVKAIRSVADDLVLDGRTAEADQLHHACIILGEAGEKLWNRVRSARKGEETS